MSKPNASYETVMVITTKDGEEATTSIIEKFKGLIESNGTIESVSEWASPTSTMASSTPSLLPISYRLPT